MSAAESDIELVQCNLRVGISEAVAGARAYVISPNLGNGCERVLLLLRSRSGRWIRKYEAATRLMNFRRKAVSSKSSLFVKLANAMRASPDVIDALTHASLQGEF